VVPVVKEKPAELKPDESLERAARWQARASLFGSGANFGAGFRAGVGAGLGVNYGRARWHFGAFLDVIGYPSADIESADALASFSLLGARVLPMVEWQATQHVTAFAGVGGGGDWIQINGERLPPGATSSATETVWEPIASGMLGMRLNLGRGVSALFALDADVALARHRYVVQTPEGTESFFQPSRVRPIALAGLSLALLGGDEPRGLPTEARR
jgi:hypothetical protein